MLLLDRLCCSNVRRSGSRGNTTALHARPRNTARGDGTLRELRFDWRHELAAAPDELWPLVADTDRFNRDTGVPPVEVLGTRPNARRRLRLRLLGVPIEWRRSRSSG